MGLSYYLSQPFAQHALLAGTLVAVISGLIGPFVITRNMAFAVHGTAELSFTGAAAGLVVADDPVAGSLLRQAELVVQSSSCWVLLGALMPRPRQKGAVCGTP